MKKQIKDYVKIVKGFLNPDICRASIKELKKVAWERHVFYDVITKNKYSPLKNNESDSTAADIKTKKAIQFKLNIEIQKYIEDLDFNWFVKFQKLSNLKFLRYRRDTSMKNHCDHIHSLFDGPVKGIPVLSIVGLFNDNYEGGEFVLFDDTTYELKQGDIIIFPSIFLYPHKVKTVTKGTRYSFVSWAV